MLRIRQESLTTTAVERIQHRRDLRLDRAIAPSDTIEMGGVDDPTTPFSANRSLAHYIGIAARLNEPLAQPPLKAVDVLLPPSDLNGSTPSAAA
ncbi:hypothetical protein ACVWZW_004758 [Bradyrhizobium sp. F1.13.4]